MIGRATASKNRRFKCFRRPLEAVGGYFYFTTFAMSHSVDWATLKTGKPTEVGSGAASRTITASSVGFMVINTACAFDQHCEVYLNGTSLGNISSGGSSSFAWSHTTLFVAKGDVVRITTSDNGGNAQITGVYFVPIS